MKHGKLSCIEFHSCFLQQCFLIDFLIGSQMWPEGCYELGLSVFSSEAFLRIGSLVFSGTQHGVKNPCDVVWDRSVFFENNIFTLKMGKMDQK